MQEHVSVHWGPLRVSAAGAAAAALCTHAWAQLVVSSAQAVPVIQRMESAGCYDFGGQGGAYLAVPVEAHGNDGAHLQQHITQHTQAISIRHL